MSGNTGTNPDRMISPDEKNGKSSEQPLSYPQDKTTIADAARQNSTEKGQEVMDHSNKNPLFQNITGLAKVNWIELL